MSKKITLEEAKELLAKAKKWTEKNNGKETNPFLKELLESKIDGSDKTTFEDLIENVEEAMPSDKKTFFYKGLSIVGFIGLTISTYYFMKSQGIWFNKE